MPTKLGQNFLTDKSVVKKIINSADLSPEDLVMEIGPGNGILTEALVERAGKVLAVEIDKKLAEALQARFCASKNLEIINADILKVNLSELVGDKKYKLIANIPYYITAPIIRLFLESAAPPGEMILMVQKEVAERITAKPGQMSVLSVAVQYYADAKIIFAVSKDFFSPTPKVDSAVIKISNIKRTGRDSAEAKDFFRIVRAGFSAKRKMLANNLSASLQLPKKEVVEKIKSAGLPLAVRAQELSVMDWKRITDLL